MKALLKHAHASAVAIGLLVTLGACDERLETGIACPTLCPHQSVAIRDTSFFPVTFDSSVAPFPVQGSESEFFVASMGDTLETVAVVRFDSLPTIFRYTPTAEDSLIYAVDSANVFLVPVGVDTVGPPVTIEIYSVDLGGPDDTEPDLAATAFTPDRLIGSRTIPADSLRDSVVVMIDNAAVLSVIQAQQLDEARGLRIGIKVNSAGEVRNYFRMFSAEAFGSHPRLRFRPHVDTAVTKTEVLPRSKVPENVFIRSLMQDYLIIVRAPTPPPSDVLRVGGIPGHRVYMAFDIPQFLIDTANVVRATLQLTQRPNPAAPQPTDTLIIREFSIVAGPEVTDLYRRLLFAQRFRGLDTLSTVAADSGLREFEIIDLIRAWRGTSPDRTPRALAFAVASEGTLPRFADFYSSEAPESVRPRLKIFYFPRVEGGLP